MIGIEYISKIFDKQYKDIANELGCSKQTVTDWVKGRSKISSKWLAKLSDMFGVEEQYFGKELTLSEQMKIQIIKLEREDISYEIPVFDDQGNEVGTTDKFENESIIRHLTDEVERVERIEILNKNMSELLNDEPIEDELNSNVKEYTDNLDAFSSLIRVLKSKNSEQKETIKLLLNILDLDNYEVEDDILLAFFNKNHIDRFIPSEKKDFAKDLIRLLMKYEIVSEENLKKYAE